jgi:queuine/archaeosine tRNA-ribosyltransferase
VDWTLELVRRVRRAITEGSLDALRAELAEHWPDGAILGGRDGESPRGTG